MTSNGFHRSSEIMGALADPYPNSVLGPRLGAWVSIGI